MFRPGVARPLKIAALCAALSGSLFAPTWLLATRPSGSGPPNVASAASLTVVHAPAPRPRPAVHRRRPKPPAPILVHRYVFVTLPPPQQVATPEPRSASLSPQRPVKGAAVKKPVAGSPTTTLRAPKPKPKAKPRPKTTPTTPVPAPAPVVIEATDHVVQTPHSGQGSGSSSHRLVAESPAGQQQPVSADDSKPSHPKPKAKKPSNEPKPAAPAQIDPQSITATPGEQVGADAQSNPGTAPAQLAPNTSDPGVAAGVQVAAPSAGQGRDPGKSKGGGKK